MIRSLIPSPLPARNDVPGAARPPVAEQHAPGVPRAWACIDRMVEGRVDPAVRLCTRDILSALPLGTLQELQRHGLTIAVTGATLPTESDRPVVLGSYQPVTRTISVGRDALVSPRGRHILLHEVTHAIDHMRSGSVARQSATNEALLDAYGDYRARAAVQEASKLESHLVAKNRPLAGFNQVLDDGWGARRLKIQPGPHADRVILDEQPHWMRGKLATMLAGGALTAAAGALAMPVLGTVGIIVGAVGALALGMNALGRGLASVDTRHVAALAGEDAVVRQQGSVTTVDLPHGAKFAPSTWSAYAFRSGLVGEYWAEGVSRYLEGPNNRKVLQRMDPQMAAQVKAFLAEEKLRRG